VVGGYRPDRENSIDALLVGFYEGKQLKFGGKIRAGLVPHSRRELAEKLRPLQVNATPSAICPAASLGGVAA
jgi:bifunctional non-homologous end joining protein LigD